MSGARSVGAALLVAVVVALAGATPAHASAVSGTWGCKSSSLYLGLLGLPDALSPLATANTPETPCKDDNSVLDQVGQLLAPLDITLADSTTNDGATPNGDRATPYDDTPTATAHIDNLTLNALIANLLQADAIESGVSASCVNNNPVYTTSGFATNIKIGTVPLNLDANLLNQTVDVTNYVAGITGLLGIHATLYINQVIDNAPDSTERIGLRLLVTQTLVGTSTLVDLRVADSRLSETGNGVHQICTKLNPHVALADSGTNRVVQANVSAVDDHKIVSCSFSVDGTTVPGTFTETDAGPPQKGTCKANLTNDPGSHRVTATATDDNGLSGTDSGSITIGTPSLATPTLSADKQSLSAVVTPAPGVAVTSCSFALAPTGGSGHTDVTGTLTGGPPPATYTCTVDQTALKAAGINGGTFDVTATATDANGDKGTSTTALGLDVLGAPTVGTITSPSNRHFQADVSPSDGGTAITGCEISIRSAGTSDPYTSIGGTVANGKCTAVASHDSWPAGSYDVKVSATQDGNATTTTTGGPFDITSPTVDSVTADHRTITVAVTPAPGTDLTACTVTLNPGATVVSGTISGNTCKAIAPPSVADGNYTADVLITDANGDTATATGQNVTLAGLPTVSNITSPANRQVTADVAPGSGNTAITACEVLLRAAGTTDPYVSAGGTVVNGQCKATAPLASFAPGSYDVRVTATADNNSSLTAQLDGGPVTIGKPVVHEPTVSGDPARKLTSTVTPAPGTAVTACAVDFFTKGTTTSVGNASGTISGGPAPADFSCDATAPDTLQAGDYDAVVTATDANGDTGASPAGITVTLGHSPGVPTVDIIDSGVNRVVAATVTPPAGGTVASCDVGIGPAGGPYTSIGGTPANGKCTANVPTSYDPGSYEVKVTAVDGEGDSASDIGAYTVGKPAISPTTVADHDLTATITPAPGTTASSCEFSIKPTAGGDPVKVTGTINAGPPPTCTGKAPDSLATGTYDITATVTDNNGDKGTSTQGGVSIPNPPPVPSPPKVVLVDTQENRAVLAQVTPADGKTVDACVISVRPNGSNQEFTTVASNYDKTAGKCTGTLPAATFVPGAYQVKVAATDSAGQTGSATGTITVAAAVVGPPKETGDSTVEVPVTPAPGTTITACSITITPAVGPPVTITGTYDAAAKVCRGVIPNGVAAGTAKVTTTVIDDDGTVSSGQGVLGIAARSAGEQLTLCPGDRQLVLTEARLVGKTVHIAGAGAPALIGKTVTIRYFATGAPVATAKVASDGLFTTTARAPKRADLKKNSSRYLAVGSGQTSRTLKLVRRAVTDSVTRINGSTIQFKGKIKSPISTKQAIAIQQLVSCGKYKTVASVKPKKNGSFTASFAKPNGVVAVILRGQTKVPSKAGGKAKNKTFTTPAPLTLL